MATDKTLNNNNYQRVPSQGQASPKSSRKTAFCLLVIFIIAISSVYSMSFRSSPAKVNAFASTSDPASSEDFASQTPRIENTRRARPQKAASENLNINVDEITKLKIQLKKSMIQASSLTEQTFPMLVSLEVKDLELDYRAPIDLVCVIDHSGSMGGEKIELVKNTFRYLLHFLNDQDRLSIVLFDDQVSTLVPLMNTTKENKGSILSAVRTVYARGGTIINGGIKQAIDILNQREVANQVTGIFLLSDGQDNMGNYQAQRMIKETFFNSGLDDGGVVIHTFGFGRDHDPELMTSIADLTDGNFFFIDTLDHVDEAFVESLGALQTSVAENVQFFIKPEQSELLKGVEIVKAYGDKSMWKQEGEVFITKSPSLITGRQKDFVLELKVPKVSKPFGYFPREVKVASCQVILSLADGRQVVKNADLKITLVGEKDNTSVDSEKDNEEVMKNYYRVKGALLMQEAGMKAEEGKYDEAKQILKDFKESVENSAVKDDELVKNMMKDMEKSMEYVSEDAYGSYGRHNLIGNQRAHMRQQANLDSNVHLTNTHMSKLMFELSEL